METHAQRKGYMSSQCEEDRREISGETKPAYMLVLFSILQNYNK